jgi:peptide/nickel transport system substrate-binding protein
MEKPARDGSIGRGIKAAAFASVAAIALFCGSVTATAQTKSTLRIKGSGDIAQIDPLFSTSYPTRDMAYLIWDTLFALDASYQPQPQMVDTYTISNDNLVYEFVLRDGLKFHDGAPVRSADAIASIKRWMGKDSLGLEIAKRLSGIEAINDKSFRIVLKEAFPQVLHGLGRMTAYPLFVMPERLANVPIGTKLPEVIGSGPFKLVANEWVPGVKFVVERFADYVPRKEPPSNLAGGKVAKVDRIERITVPDETSAVNALLAGELDFVAEVPTDLMPLVERNQNIAYGLRPQLGKSVQIVLNHTLPPLDNIKIRQAVQAALSQQDFMTTLFGNRKEVYKLCAAIFMCDGPYETDANSARYMNKNVELAKRLLKEGGYDGTPIVYMHPTDGKLQMDGGAVLVESLRKAGFNVRDDLIDTATMFSRRNNKGPVSAGGWNMFLTAFGGDALMDPLTNPYVTGACEKAFVGWPCDAELQAAWQSFLVAGSPAARKEAAIKIQARSNEIVTFIPMGQYSDYAAWSKKVTGMIDSPILLYWNVEKKN